MAAMHYEDIPRMDIWKHDSEIFASAGGSRVSLYGPFDIPS